MFFHIVRFFLWLPLMILFPTKVVGRKNLKKGKAIICPNHTSNMDIVVLLANTFEKKYVLAKKELFKNKFLGFFIKMFGGISVDRDNYDVGAIKKSLKVLNKNKKLVIFPEGTRNKNKDISTMNPLKTGTALLAIKTKTPVIPVWISSRPRPFRLTKIIVGEAFEMDKFYDKKASNENLSQATEIINEKLNALK